MTAITRIEQAKTLLAILIKQAEFSIQSGARVEVSRGLEWVSIEDTTGWCEDIFLQGEDYHTFMDAAAIHMDELDEAGLDYVPADIKLAVAAIYIENLWN